MDIGESTLQLWLVTEATENMYAVQLGSMQSKVLCHSAWSNKLGKNTAGIHLKVAPAERCSLKLWVCHLNLCSQKTFGFPDCWTNDSFWQIFQLLLEELNEKTQKGLRKGSSLRLRKKASTAPRQTISSRLSTCLPFTMKSSLQAASIPITKWTCKIRIKLPCQLVEYNGMEEWTCSYVSVCTQCIWKCEEKVTNPSSYSPYQEYLRAVGHPSHMHWVSAMQQSQLELTSTVEVKCSYVYWTMKN